MKLAKNETCRIYLLMALPLLFCLSGCHPMPKVPAGIEAGSDDSTIVKYSRIENDYAAAFFQQHDKFRAVLLNELLGRETAKHPQDSLAFQSCHGADGKSKIYISGNEVRLKKAGSGGEDAILFRESDPAFKLKVFLSRSGNFIFIESFSETTSEVSFLSSDLQHLQQPRLVSPREQGHIYSVNHFGGNYFWILSNQKAPNRKLFVAPVMNPGQSGWNTAILPNDSVFIEGYTILNENYLVLLQRKNMTTGMQITEIFPSGQQKEKIENKISFTDPLGHISDISYEPAEDKIVFRYSGMRNPLTCYAYGIRSRKLSIRWRTQVKGYNPDDYTAKVIPLALNDGRKICLSLMQRQNMAYTDGSNPMLICINSLEGSDNEPAFNASFLSLLDRGFVIAVADPETFGGGTPEQQEKDLMAIGDAMAKEKYSSADLISIYANNNFCPPVCRLLSNKPIRPKSVILVNPPRFTGWTKQEYPQMFMINHGRNGANNATDLLMTASAIRRNQTGKNLLLIRSINHNEVNEKLQLMADQWLFLLSSYGMKK